MNMRLEPFFRRSCLIIFISSVLLYLLYQLYAFFFMGEGSDGSFWIFNVDNAYRLTHVFQLLKSESYPPPSLSNLDVSFHYHYGGPAIAAFFSGLFNIEVHKTYFYLVMPFLLITGFTLLYLVSVEKTKSKFFAVSILMIFMLHRINFSNIYDRMNGLTLEAYYMMRNLDFSVFLTGFTHSDPGRFGNTIYDIAYLVNYIVIPVFVTILLIRDQYKRVVIWLIFLMLGFFLKTEVFLISLLFICLESFTFFYCKANRKTVLFVNCIIFSLLIFIGPLFNYSLPLIGYVLDYNLLNLMSPRFGYAIFFQCIPIVILGVYLWKVDDEFFHSKNALTLSIIYISVFFIIFINYTDIYLQLPTFKQGISDFFRRACNSVFIISIIFLLLKNQSSFNSQYLQKQKYLLAPLCIFPIIAVMQFYHLINHFFIIVNFPERAHEVVEIGKQRECLKEIPTINTLLLLNSFDYPAQNYRRKNNAMHITANYGHQAYASNSGYEPFDFVKERLERQKNILTNPDSNILQIHTIAPDVEGVDKYIYFDKRKPIPKIVLKEAIFENSQCLIFKLDKNN